MNGAKLGPLGIIVGLALSLPVSKLEAQVCECTCYENVGQGGDHTCESPPLLLDTGPIHVEPEVGDCSTHGHDVYCEINLAEELEAVVEAVAEGAVDDLNDVMALLGENAYFNEDRQAIQVVGCNDVIIANIPVGRELAMVLADRE